MVSKWLYTIENEKKEAETMNINKFTQKSIEAVNQCEKIAYDYGNQEIDQEHFLYSLMTIDDSLIANLIEKNMMDYYLGEHMVIWFSMIFYKES